MKQSRFTEEQMVEILRKVDQAPIAEVAKTHGVSDVKIYVWRKRFRAVEVARCEAPAPAAAEECQAQEGAGGARP